MSEIMAEKVVDSTPKTVVVLGGSYAGMHQPILQFCAY